MRNDSRGSIQSRYTTRPGDTYSSTLAVTAVVLSVFVVCTVLAWVDGRGPNRAGSRVYVWPQSGQNAAELVRRIRRVDGVRDAVAIYRGSVQDEDYSNAGWADVYYLANRTDTPALAFMPPDPDLKLWKGHQPDVQSPDEVLVAHELAQSLGIELGQTLQIRGVSFLVAGIWGPSARVPGNWLQISPAAADLIDPSSTNTASYVIVLPATNDEAQQVASRIRDRWDDLEVTSPDGEASSAAREQGLMVAAVVVGVMIALLLGVLGLGAGDTASELSPWVVVIAGVSGVALSWVVGTFVNLYARTTYGVTPFTVSLAVVGASLVVTLLIYVFGRLPAAKRIGFHLASTAVLFCLCVGVVMVLGAARESLSLTIRSAREASTDWVSLGDTPATESLMQAIYRLPGIRALAFETYGGPVLEEDTRWRSSIPAAGVLYGVESASGVGSWSLPISGGFADGGDLVPGMDQVVIGYDLAIDQGLGVGDVMVVRGTPLLVVGVRGPELAFAGSDAGRRVYVTFEMLERILHQRGAEKQVTLLVPSADSQETKDIFLREVATRLRVNGVRTIDDRLGEIVINYPGAWTITVSSPKEAVRHAQSLYDVLMVLVSLLAAAVALLSLAAAWGRSVSAEKERIGLLKALGSTEGGLLGDYLQRIMLFGAACGLAGVILGRAACGLLNEVGHEGAFELVVTPSLGAGAFVGSILVALLAAAPAVAAAVRRDATSSLYVSAVESPGAARPGMEAMRGGSEP